MVLKNRICWNNNKKNNTNKKSKNYNENKYCLFDRVIILL